MKRNLKLCPAPWFGRVGIIILITILAATPTYAQTRPGSTASPLAGRTVEDVRVMGNAQVSTAVILNLVRTRPGDKLDPATVEEDYQRIYGLRKFSNVEAKVEPTATGVVVVFVVSEQKQITAIIIRGNFHLDEQTVRSVIDVHVGEAIDRFRISLARQAIENLYKEKNYPFTHVEIDNEALSRRGELIFNIVEGPNVRVRNITFTGNHSFTGDRLRKQIQTSTWIWILRHGTYNAGQLEDDVASLRRFYEQKGFFDARVGRKVIFSPDMTEVQVDFVIEEGIRYTIDRVTFHGNASVSEAELRKNLRLVEGTPYDSESLQRDVREIVRAYSPFGFIYQPQAQDPDYLRIDPRPVFRHEAGTVELVYDISEGRPFRMGRIIVKGNSKTQDKVVLREMHVFPGQLYNSGELQSATERIRTLPAFSGATITPTGDDPEVRDVLVEVTEQRTASFNVGAGVNSNGGVGANLTYEQKNFDIANWPARWSDLFSDRSFTGAGQTFRASFEPGTEQTNLYVRFSDPYIFDQPYGFSAEAFMRNRIYDVYTERPIGVRFGLEKRFDQVWSARLNTVAENVQVRDIDDPEVRADEINDAKGNNFQTALGLTLRRDTSNRGALPYKGSTATATWQSYGALGGEFTFQKFIVAYDWYKLLYEDLTERKTVLEVHLDGGYIVGNDPFFDRFYGGGIGSIRGFQFRGVSPRSGPADDAIGGDFVLLASGQVSFPLVGETLRGVVFTDMGTVESSVEIKEWRSSIGAGFRLTLPFFGQIPIAVDAAIPLTKNSDDETQIVSFSIGINQ
ncbi:MAG: BamA/OMP85 family outer membrane protein [Tepidisphaeraceae bacterium]